MKKALALTLSLILIIQSAGCSRKPSLDINYFEKFVLSDLELEKKEGADDQAQGYYSLDNSISQYTDAKLDHYSQVYSSATNGTVGNLYMIYYDYQDATDANNFYTEISNSEKEFVNSSPDTHRYESGDDYIVVLSTKDQITFYFECLYIRNDILVYASVLLSASDLENLDKDWLRKVDELFNDLRLHSPFGIEPKIKDLL